jgi:hypothetical protein
MTFSYNPNLPNPPDDPADDVPGMQINATSISNILAVDHVGFNVTGGGQHAKITFNANNSPTPPVSPPVLFTNNPGSAPLNYPQIYFYSGNAAQSSTQYISAGAGSVLLFGGTIMKWGSGGITSGSANITFASAFPNNCYVVLTTIMATSGQTYSVTVSNVSTTGFTAHSPVTGGPSFYYTAIGN